MEGFFERVGYVDVGCHVLKGGEDFTDEFAHGGWWVFFRHDVGGGYCGGWCSGDRRGELKGSLIEEGGLNGVEYSSWRHVYVVL